MKVWSLLPLGWSLKSPVKEPFCSSLFPSEGVTFVPLSSLYFATPVDKTVHEDRDRRDLHAAEGRDVPVSVMPAAR